MARSWREHRSACRDARDERGIAPGEVLCGRLLAGALVELLREIAARGREGADGLEKCVAARAPGRALRAASSMTAGGQKTELGRAECREVIGAAGKVRVAFVSAHRGRALARSIAIDRIQ